MPVPSRRPLPSRRRLLRASVALPALGLAAASAGCGPVRIGAPETYTPPPPGIDDLYREDLLAQLEALMAGVRDLTPPDPLTELLTALRANLALQRDALLTGAEAEDESSAAAGSRTDSGSTTGTSVDPSDSATTTGTSTTGGSSGAPVPTDLPSLVAALVAARDLAADACIQCSGSLSRVIGGIAAHLTWAAGRIVLLAADPALTVPAPPAADALVPTRTVPRNDPPSVGAKEDYQTYLTRTQSDEWYAGYVSEVMAARAQDRGQRSALVDRAAEHRAAAASLSDLAEKDGLTAVAEEPVYPLPGGGADPVSMQMLPGRIGTFLLVDWVSMIGAVPFERRALATARTLVVASELSSEAAAVDPLPSLEKTEG